MSRTDEPRRALLERAARDVHDGGLPGCAVTVLRHGEVLVDEVIGAPADATWMLWSACKVLVSGTVASLVAEGSLDVTSRVAEHLPWFVGEGKELVTVEHLLLHTAGLAGAPMRVVEGGDTTRRRERMLTWRTSHAPGTAYRYHHTSAHWVLATVIEEVTGLPHATAWQGRMADRMGLTSLTFSPNVDDQRLQRLVACGQPTPDDVVETLRGQGIDLDLMVAEADVETLLTFDDPEVLAVGSPGAGAVGSANDLARFYDAFLRGHPALDDIVRRDFIGNVRNDLADPDLPMTAARTLGFVVSGSDGAAGMRQLPTSLGPRVFGHSGMCGQIAWADPDTGLVFVHLTNGLQRDPLQWWARVGELNELAAAMAE